MEDRSDSIDTCHYLFLFPIRIMAEGTNAQRLLARPLSLNR